MDMSRSPSMSSSTPTTPDSKSSERLSSFSRSHQDLSKLDEELALRRYVDTNLNSSSIYGHQGGNNNGGHYANLPNVGNYGLVESLPPTPTRINTTIIEQLWAENHSLKTELEAYKRRVYKLQQFEQGIQQVHQSHEELIRSADKKEKLERAVRYKLEIELRRLQAQNKDLKEQHGAALVSIAATKNGLDGCGQDRDEIQKRDLLIAQLLTQNKELLGDKETQEYELQAQRLTLEEQRNHIEILDSALMYAQNNVVKLESELRKKQAYEERANHLQKALANLQLASDRRLQMEKRVRTHLEKEIENLKKYMNGKGSLPTSPMQSEFDELKKVVREYEEKIIQLETEVTKWEQKYLEESALRQIEVSAASAPKDAKIAALEKTSQEGERMIVEARNERLKHMDELHYANKRAAELEGRVRDIESKLAEKEAMIKVLQQHSRDNDAALQKSIFAHRVNPAHTHTRSVSSMGLTTRAMQGDLSKGPLNSPASGQRPPLPFPRHDFVNKYNTLDKDASNHISEKSISGLNGGLIKLTKERSGSSASSSPSSGVPESGGSSSSSTGSISNSRTNVDDQLKELKLNITSSDSIIRALRSEKERYPNHFWRL